MKRLRIFFKPLSSNLIIALWLSFLGAQSHPGIHQRQAEYYRVHYREPIHRPDTTSIIDLQPRAFSPSRTVFGYHPYWQGTDWQYYNFDLLSTIAFFSADVSTTGQLSNLHGWPVTELINTAHTHGVKVVLVATLFGSNSIATLLSSPTSRQNLINNLLTQVQAGNADGVNIDFEGLPSPQRQNMVQFITDLATTFHSAIPGSEVTLAMPAVDWSNAWDYSALASVSDGLFIMGYDYHWSGSDYAGAVAPLSGGTYNVTWTVNDYLSKTGNQANKLILGVPYYGIEWPTVSSSPGAATTGSGSAQIYRTAFSRAQTYGRNWDASSQTPWYAYNSSGWFQGWYDDEESLALKYNLALTRNLKGVGIWALGYDLGHQELWNLLAATFGTSLPPTAPESVALYQSQGTLWCTFTGATNAESFSVIRYTTNGTVAETLGPFTDIPFAITGLPENEPSWLRIQANNAFGSALSTDILAYAPDSVRADALIVQGFDRESGTTNLHDTAIRHGLALAANGLTFDCATNEAVESGTIDLRNYGMVDWILGEEGSGSSTLTSAEQEKIKSYLEAGGRLFISGSEIGYDLVAQGNASDQAFYSQYLKAQYVSDAAGGHQGVYSLDGTGILADMTSISFDNGTHGTYDVDWPDGILPTDGADVCATYSGVDENANGAAGIVYTGTFGSSNTEAALVYMAVGFETLYPEDMRTAVMHSILDYLGQGPIITPGDTTQPALQFGFTAIYPNPAITTPFVTFEFKSDSSTAVTLTIYTLLGQRLVHAELQPEDQQFVWNRRFPDQMPAPSGVYFVRLRQGDQIDNQTFTLLK